MTKQRAVTAVKATLAQVRVAEVELALWADEVRRAAEVRMGIGPDDERAWDDPAYAAALDRYGEFQATRERIEGVLERMTGAGSGPPEKRSE